MYRYPFIILYFRIGTNVEIMNHYQQCLFSKVNLYLIDKVELAKISSSWEVEMHLF